MKSLFSSSRASKRGVNSLQGLLVAVIFFGLIGVVGGIMGLIQDDVATEFTPASWSDNNSEKAQEAQGKIFGKLPLVGTIIVLSFVLFLILGVVAYFVAGRYGSGQVPG